MVLRTKTMDNYPKEDPGSASTTARLRRRPSSTSLRNTVSSATRIVFDLSLHIAEERVGKERLKWSYNWKGFFDRDIPVAII